MSEDKKHHHHHHHHHNHGKDSHHGDSENHKEKRQKTELDTVFENMKLIDFCNEKSKSQHHGVITIKSVDTLDHLLKMMEKHNIISCPVLNEDNEFIGFVDVLDISGHVLATWRKFSPKLEEGKFPTEEFFHTHVEKILNLSGVDPTVVISQDKSMKDLVDLFSDQRTNRRLHRVAVLDHKKCLVNIISQSDITNFAFQHLSSMPSELTNATVKDMNIRQSVITVRLDTPFIDTLDILYRNRISGLAFVDDEYRLAGNISASDLRGLSPSSFKFFLGSTLQFTVKGKKFPSKPSKYVGEDTTFSDLLKTLCENKIHRVYVLDSMSHPRAVITLGDVISRLFS